MYEVYVLQSLKDQNLYIGLTKNLEERIKRNNAGYEQSTKSRRPFKILASFPSPNLKEARLFEKALKSGKGREMIKEFIAGKVTYGGLLKWPKTCLPQAGAG